MTTTTDKALYLFCKLFDDDWDYSHDEWEFMRTVNNAAKYYGTDPFQDAVDGVSSPDFETLNFNSFIDRCANVLDCFFDSKSGMTAEQKSSILYELLYLKTLWLERVKSVTVYPGMAKEEYEEKLQAGVSAVKGRIESILFSISRCLGLRPAEDMIAFLEAYLRDSEE